MSRVWPNRPCHRPTEGLASLGWSRCTGCFAHEGGASRRHTTHQRTRSMQADRGVTQWLVGSNTRLVSLRCCSKRFRWITSVGGNRQNDSDFFCVVSYQISPRQVATGQSAAQAHRQDIARVAYLPAAGAVDPIVARQCLFGNKSPEAGFQRDRRPARLGQLHADIPKRVEAGRAAAARTASQCRHELATEQVADLP